MRVLQPVKKNSVVDFVIRLCTDCSIFGLFHFGSILGMHTLHPVFPRRQAMLQIKAIDAIPFLEEIHGASFCYPPGGTPT